MTRKEKIALGSAILLFVVVSVAIYWDYLTYYLNKAKDKVKGNPVPASSTSGQGGSGSTTSGSSAGGGVHVLDMNKLLKRGVYDSPEVQFLQSALNTAQPSNPLVVDGDFGPLTEAKLYAVAGVKQITLQQAQNMLQNLF